MIKASGSSPRVQKQNVGNAGECYVAALLSAMNYTATVTLGRAERYDVLAVSPDGRPYKLSVKARFQRESTAFTLSEGDETGYEDDLFYVFVRLYELKRQPDYWVVPSKIVAKVIADSHKKWLADPGRHGACHNPTTMRKLPIELRGQDRRYYDPDWETQIGKYKNTFDALESVL